MTREEFLRTLGEKLATLPADERDDAVKYYSEYLDEAGQDNEQQAIDELGDINRVANIIIANSPTYQSGNYKASNDKKPKPELTLDGPDWASKQKKAEDKAPNNTSEDANKGTAQNTSNSQNTNYNQSADYTQNTQQNAPKYTAYNYDGVHPQTDDKNIAKFVIIIICCIIFLPPFISAVFGIFFGLIGLVFGIVAACIALVVSAIVVAVSSVGLFATSVASGIATLGLGLICAAAGVIVGRAIVIAGIHLIPKFINFIKKVFIKIKAKVVQYK